MKRYAIIAAAALCASGSAGPGVAASPKRDQAARDPIPMVTQYDCKDVHEDELGRVETTTTISGVDEGAQPRISSFMKWSMPTRSEGVYLRARQIVDLDEAPQEPRKIDIHFATGAAGKKEARIELQRLPATRDKCCSDDHEISFTSPFLRPVRQSGATGYEIMAPARLDELRILMGSSDLLVTLVRREPTNPRAIVAKDTITSAMLARPLQAFTAAQARVKAQISDYRTSCEKQMFRDEPVIVAALERSAGEHPWRGL